MADPLTALGLATNIIQLIDFTGDLISKTWEVSKSADGILVENLELEAITSSLQQLSNGLRHPGAGGERLGKTGKQL